MPGACALTPRAVVAVVVPPLAFSNGDQRNGAPALGGGAIRNCFIISGPLIENPRLKL